MFDDAIFALAKKKAGASTGIDTQIPEEREGR
jgi:hypothetical protein